MSKKTFRIFLVIITVICLLILSSQLPYDKVDITVSGSDLTPVKHVDSLTIGEYVVSLDEPVDYASDLLKSEKYVLAKGKYQLSLSYSAHGGIDSIEILSKFMPSENNEGASVLYSWPLEEGENITQTFDFELPETVYDAEVRFVYGGGVFQVNSLDITSDSYVHTDAIFITLLFAVISLFLLYWYTKKKPYSVLLPKDRMNSAIVSQYAPLICILIALLATLPYLGGGLIRSGDDMVFHQLRIESLKIGMESGQFPVRIGSMFLNQNGLCTSIMYGDIFLYPAALMRMIGVSLPTSIAVLSFLINLFTAWGSYFCIKKVTKSVTIGMMFSMIYTLCVYRLVNMYMRNAMGEAIAMAFLPFVILGIYQLVYGNAKDYKWLVIGFAGLIACHVISTFLCGLFVIIFLLINIKKMINKQRIFSLVKAVALTCLIDAFFLIPFLSFSRYDLNVMHADNSGLIQMHSFPFFKLFANGYDFSIGILLIIAVVLFIFCIYKSYVKNDNSKLIRIGTVFLCVGIVAFIMSSNLFPWMAAIEVPVLGSMLRKIGLPWRLNAFSSICFSVILAISIYYLAKDKIKRVTMVVFCLIVVLLSANTFFSGYSNDETRLPIDKQQSFSLNRALHEYAYYSTNPNLVLRRQPTVASSNPDSQITNLHRFSTTVDFDFECDDSPSEIIFDVPLYYYPGYTALLNNSLELVIAQEPESGLVRVVVPAGYTAGTVSIQYTGQWYFIVGNVVSVATLSSIFIIWIIKRRKKFPETT